MNASAASAAYDANLLAFAIVVGNDFEVRGLIYRRENRGSRSRHPAHTLLDRARLARRTHAGRPKSQHSTRGRCVLMTNRTPSTQRRRFRSVDQNLKGSPVLFSVEERCQLERASFAEVHTEGHATAGRCELWCSEHDLSAESKCRQVGARASVSTNEPDQSAARKRGLQTALLHILPRPRAVDQSGEDNHVRVGDADVEANKNARCGGGARGAYRGNPVTACQGCGRTHQNQGNPVTPPSGTRPPPSGTRSTPTQTTHLPQEYHCETVRRQRATQPLFVLRLRSTDIVVVTASGRTAGRQSFPSDSCAQDLAREVCLTATRTRRASALSRLRWCSRTRRGTASRRPSTS